MNEPAHTRFLAIKRFIESEIHFSTFEHRFVNTNFSIANVHGIEVKYSNFDDTKFEFRSLSMKYAGRRFKIEKLFGLEKYKSFFNEFKLTFENSVQAVFYERRYTLVSSKLFWLMIHWFNRLLCISTLIRIYFEIDIFKDEVQLEPQEEYKPNVDFITMFGLRAPRDKRDGFICFHELAYSMLRRYGEEVTRNQQTLFKSPKLVQDVENFKKQSIWNDKTIEETRAVYRSPCQWMHPNLALLMLDKLEPIYLLDTLLDFYQMHSLIQYEDEEMNVYYKIDLNTTLVSHIDENFGYARHDDLLVRFHKGSSYIHAASTAEAIYGDTEKMKHFSDRFMSNKDTKDFINELESEIRANTEFDKTNEIESQLNEHPSWFILEQAGRKYELRGYFLHPELFMLFVFWLSKKRAIRYIRMINIMCNRAAIRNITINQKLQAEAKRRELEAKEFRKSIKELNHEIKAREIAETGSIIVSQTERGIKLYYSTINEPDAKDRIVYRDIYHPKETLERLNKELANSLQRIQKSLYGGNIEENRNEIEVAIEKSIIKTETEEFIFNENEYQKRLQRYEADASDSARGYLYESVCSRNLKIPLYSDMNDAWFYKFGLSKKDPGIDLVDAKNKVVYQCKYYAELKPSQSLDRTKSAYMKIRAIDNSYTLKLIVPEACRIHSRVISLFGELNIIRMELESSSESNEETSIVFEPIEEFVETKRFEFNETEYQLLLQEYESNRSDYLKAELYKFICSRQIEAVLYKDVTDDWLAHFVLTKDDIGIDLVDIENKRIYQCKYYSVLKYSSQIQHSQATYAKIKDIDSEYEFILIVPTKCYVHKNARAAFDEIHRIDFS